MTGTAGFIGSHVARRLLAQGHRVVGFDSMNDYYDPRLKFDRLALFREHDRYHHVTGDLADRSMVESVFDTLRPARVIHLAAQAGVRYAAKNPHAYVASNVTGFLHVLEGCRHHEIRHLIYASTSSVYGANTAMPFAESQSTEHPLTLYAATKKADEMMAHAYAHLYRIPCTGLRFFTVYGPWGRPDMSPILFADAIWKGETLKVFNHGNHSRSFTYIDDIAEAIVQLLGREPEANESWTSEQPDPGTSGVAPYRVYNIGHREPIRLMAFIELLEKNLGRNARKEMLPLQPGDVPDTHADTRALADFTGHAPTTSIESGVARFCEWYREYYG